MNLAIRGIEANLGEPDSAGSFRREQFPDLKAGYVLANPPFNDSDWSGEQLIRWKFGAPPVGNANFAWVQHFVHQEEDQGLVKKPAGYHQYHAVNEALTAAVDAAAPSGDRRCGVV